MIGNRQYCDVWLYQPATVFVFKPAVKFPAVNKGNKYNKIHKVQELVQQTAQLTSETQGIIKLDWREFRNKKFVK